MVRTPTTCASCWASVPVASFRSSTPLPPAPSWAGPESIGRSSLPGGWAGSLPPVPRPELVRLLASSAGHDAAALVPGRDLVLALRYADGLALPVGVFVNDLLDRE